MIDAQLLEIMELVGDVMCVQPPACFFYSVAIGDAVDGSQLYVSE